MQRLNRYEDNAIIQNGTEYPDDFFQKYTHNVKRVVRKLPLDIFQERLIHYFDIRFKKNNIFWLKRGNKINRVY